MDSNGCYDPDQQCWVGLNEIPHPEIRLSAWPNPTNDELNLELDQSINEGRIEIVDMAGRVWQSRPWPANDSKMTLSTAMLPEGIYGIAFRQDGQVVVRRKVVVVR